MIFSLCFCFSSCLQYYSTHGLLLLLVMLSQATFSCYLCCCYSSTLSLQHCLSFQKRNRAYYVAIINTSPNIPFSYAHINLYSISMQRHCVPSCYQLLFSPLFHSLTQCLSQVGTRVFLGFFSFFQLLAAPVQLTQ